MSVFGGMSKGERNRTKIRVRAAMAAQAKDEGRFLGGRPPYGYLIADAGPHPNPAKAADGKRAHRLDLDPEAAAVVRRIFAEFIAGHGFYAIAEGLTRDSIPSPSAHDPARNRHRCGVAWNKFAVRAILTNPRYTGHQVWSKQRKDEVLIDVEDVAQGHVTKLRWNESGKWVWSAKIVQPPIIDRETFDQVQTMISGRATKHAGHKPHRRQHSYELRGCIWCGLCGRRMQSHWVNGAPYYRCRFAAEYALANRVDHPLNVNLREDAVVGHVDQWLAREFAPHRLTQTIRDLAAADQTDAFEASEREQAARKIAECDAKLAQYRAALDAGASPVTVAGWIAETEAERASYEAGMRKAGPRPRMSEAEITAIVDKLADIARVRHDADPDDKAEIFRQLGLKLTYHPGRQLVKAQVEGPYWYSDSVRGGT
jgi:site-specific DNA recombinase